MRLKHGQDMISVNQLRKQAGFFSLGVAAVLFAASIVLAVQDSWDWAIALGIFALIMLGSGVKQVLAVTIIDLGSGLLRMASRHTEPKWEGEILHTDAGRHQIRHLLDRRGQPHFLASDICAAIGTQAPHRDALHWGGAPLLLQGRHLCFPRAAVETYLGHLAVKNREATRLLTLLRNDVFRKLDRQQGQA